MNSIAKLLIVGGASLILAGLIWHFAGRYLHLGRLPGDIAIERDHTTIYVPIVTCIVLSVLLSLILSIWRWFAQ